MKLKTQILFALFVLPVILTAQEKIEVVQKSVTISKGEQPAYVVLIPQADFEQVSDDWVKAIRQNTKSKVIETDHEFEILDTEIKDIISKPINLYSALIRMDSSVKIIAAFEIDSSFFSFSEESKTVETEKTHHNIQNFMRDFALEQYKDYVSQELSDAEKVLRTKNSEYKDIVKQIETYQKDIQENEQSIRNSQDLISSYEGENERKLAEINSKKESIASLSGDSELTKQAKDQLKDLEKEKRGIENKLEKENKNIVGYQSKIKEYDRQISDSLEKKTAKNDEIKNQESLIDSIKSKLAGIK
jgi:chromosome segregation ATPase